ncbi:MAG: tetratricopeptide repeat protein [Phycisphaerales bacterium]
MASNVNMKFVAILTGVIVALSVVVGAAFVSTKLKSADELEAMGDKAMAAGEYDDARLYYSKAVNKEQNNLRRLEKWLDSIEQWKPETETEYTAAFDRTFMVAHRGIAEADPLNPETQANFLELLQKRSSFYSDVRGAGNRLIQAADLAISRFEDNPSAPEGWERLKRYRGMAIQRIMSSTGAGVSAEERTQAIEDLEAAIEADPTDGEALITLARIWVGDAERLYDADRPEEADAMYAQALQRVDEFRRGAPNEPWSSVFRPMIEFQRELNRRVYGLLSDEAREVRRELIPQFRGAFDEAISTLESMGGDVTESQIGSAQQFEGAMDPDGGLRRTRALIDRAIEAQPDRSDLLLYAAQIAEQVGDRDEALEWYEEAAGLPDLPMSLDGFLRFTVRRMALVSQADLLIRQALEQTQLSEEDREAKLTRAEALRSEYAERVTADDPRLLFIDGLLQVARQDTAAALRSFQRYNELTGNSDPRGLWREGQSAATLGQNGLAERAFERLIDTNPSNTTALYALGEVKLALQKNVEAEALFARAAEIAPENEGYRQRAEIARAVSDPDAAEDPVVGTLIRWQKTRLGDAQTPGDPVAARRILEQGLIDHNQDPRIVQRLVGVLLSEDDIARAREVARAGAAANPDDTTLPLLVRGLENDTILEARLWIIEQADAPEIEKAIERINVYQSEGDTEGALAALDAAEAIDPNDPRVIEARFGRLLTEERYADAERLVERATELDADNMGGLSYQARLASARGRFEEAAEIMRQAIEQGAAPAPAYRLLALQQRAAGRPADAATTLERALEIAPNDVRTINDYLSTLVAIGRLDDALDAARRSERFGRGNADFRNNWLNLEAAAGGDAGRALAIQRRERIMETEPNDVANAARLAGLYIDERRWTEAKAIIDRLRAEEDSIGLVTLLATWYADQGRLQVDGTVRNGMDMARSVFTDYIVRIPEDEMTVTPWMAMATFLIERGDLPSALLALEEASELQSEDREVDKLLGDLMLERGRFAQAHEAYERIVEADADDARQTYLQRYIEASLRLGRYDEALASLDRLNEPAASSLTALLQRAEAVGGTGDQAAATDLLTRAVNENPDRPMAFILRARAVLAQGGRVQDALADLDNALRIDPNSTRARRMRAGVYFRDGRTEDAIRDLREVVRQDPALTDVAFALVQELLSSDRERDAISVVDEVVQKRPQDLRAVVGFASIFGSREMWDRASQLYETAWTRSRNPSAGARLIDALLRQDNPRVTRARAVLAEIRDVVPDGAENPGILALEASIAEVAGESARAEDLLRRSFEAAAGDPQEVFNWSTNFGQVYQDRTAAEKVSTMRSIRTGLTDAADRRWLDLLIGRQLVADDATREEGIGVLASLRRERRDDTVALVAFQTEGAAHYAAENWERAEEVWKDGLSQFPTDAEMSNNVAFVLVDKLGDADGALDYALAAVENSGGRAAMQDTLATVYIALERFDEAQQSLNAAEQVAQSNKDRLDILVNRAKLAIAQGESGRARQMLNDALEATVPLGAERESYETQIQEMLEEIGTDGD